MPSSYFLAWNISLFTDKFINSVMAKDVVQQGKYIAMVTAKYSQMHTKEQVRNVEWGVVDVTCMYMHAYL